MINLTSFCATVSGQPRELFRVIEKKGLEQGLTLLIGRGTGDKYRGDAVSPTDDPYCESRISLHTSPNTPDGNLFHRTLRTRDTRIETRIWTEAIKKNTGFVPVLYKLCAPMISDGYEPSPKSNIINIGTYDRNLFNLCFAILVSAPGRDFRYLLPSHRRLADSNLGPGTIPYQICEPLNFHTITARFARFTLTILTSYLTGPAAVSGHSYHPDTLDPKKNPDITPEQLEINQWMAAGRSEHQSIADFDQIRWQLLEKYIQAANIAPSEDEILNSLRFMAYPSVATIEAQRHIRQLWLYEALHRHER